MIGADDVDGAVGDDPTDPSRRRPFLSRYFALQSCVVVVARFALARARSIGHAIAGFGFVARNETNMRIHLVMAGAAIAAGIALGITSDEWRWLIVAIVMVMAGEALNTAIEQACDAIGGRSEAIRRAKDAAAGGVLVLAIGAVLIGLGIFLPHLAALTRAGSLPLRDGL